MVKILTSFHCIADFTNDPNECRDTGHGGQWREGLTPVSPFQPGQDPSPGAEQPAGTSVRRWSSSSVRLVSKDAPSRGQLQAIHRICHERDDPPPVPNATGVEAFIADEVRSRWARYRG